MLTRPRFWSLLPSIILDWVVLTVSVSPSVDAMKHADTSRECYLKYFAHRPHRTDLLLVGAREHYSGCTSLHLRKRIAARVTHHPPAWHASHIYENGSKEKLMIHLLLFSNLLSLSASIAAFFLAHAFSFLCINNTHYQNKK